ncbi:MAG: hypothetical protein ACO34E_09030 [Limisphaerales bacterium]
MILPAPRFVPSVYTCTIRHQPQPANHSAPKARWRLSLDHQRERQTATKNAILASGSNNPQLPLHLRSNPRIKLLSKPYPLEQLLPTLHQLLASK